MVGSVEQYSIIRNFFHIKTSKSKMMTLETYFKRREDTVMVLGVFSNPGVTIVDVCLVDVLVDHFWHYDKPFG
jgi:hypothetical protein